MKIVVGLGNIGDHFNGTRHNIGFTVLDSFSSDWQDKPKFKSQICEQTISGEKVIFVKPKTYYNLSGEAVLAIKNFFKVVNHDILVIHDELALPFGTIRTRLSGSDAGNNGIKSVNANLGNDYARIRVGIANDFSNKTDAADFVLGHFTKQENQQMNDICLVTKQLIFEFVNNKLEQTTKVI